MEKPVVVFVRHKFAPDIVRCLWDRQQIALQYQNIPSATPDDYEKKTAYEAIKRLRGFCEQGVIVAASYRAYEPAKLLIGTIGPGDPDKLIRIENLKGYFNKIVQIENAIEVQYSDYPILTVQPTGGTISQWPIAADSVRAIYAGEPLKGVHDLAPGQLEVLCYEYLCLIEKIGTLVLPLGRNLIDIDIYGFQENGKTTIAQVTHAAGLSQISDKYNRLLEYMGDDTDVFFFGPDSSAA